MLRGPIVQTTHYRIPEGRPHESRGHQADELNLPELDDRLPV